MFNIFKLYTVYLFAISSTFTFFRLGIGKSHKERRKVRFEEFTMAILYQQHSLLKVLHFPLGTDRALY